MTQKIYCVVEEVKKDLTSFNIEDGDAIVDMKEFSDYLNKELSFKVNTGCLVEPLSLLFFNSLGNFLKFLKILPRPEFCLSSKSL